MTQREEAVIELSKNRIRQLTPIIREYSFALGFPETRRSQSAKQLIVSICNSFEEIGAKVRPHGGRVTLQQCVCFARYMIENPTGRIDPIRISEIITTNAGARVARSNRRKSKRKSTDGESYIVKRDLFYRSWEWKKARYQALQAYGHACLCCGAKKGDQTIDGKLVRIVVDHIKPLYRNWELRLSHKNLQVLCHDCNMGKGSWDKTDWREQIN